MKYTKHEFMEKFGLSFEYYKELENEISKSYKRMTRTDVLNHLIQRYNLKRYLEIGVQVPALNFDKIQCEYKVGVDPDPKALASLQMTSDQFFKNPRLYLTDSIDDDLPPFDLIFIDGLHTAEQVKKDFENALKILCDGGFIVLHDVNPETYDRTLVPRPTPTGTWNGSTYKFAVAFEDSPHVYTVDVDHGCMVIQKKEGLKWGHVSYLNWEFFDQYRKELLHLISWDEFIKL